MTRIDRRALFTSGAAAALLAATGTSLAAAPRAGGVLRLAVPRQDGLMEQVARGAVFDTLTEIAPDGVLRGELAEGWHSSDAARTWSFDLRSDVRFHDGVDMTAADVVASLSGRGIDGAEVALVQQVADHRIEIQLTAANPHLPYLLADPAHVIAPAGQVDLPLAQVVGTGCYRVERAQDGRHFRAAKLADHYKAGQAGWVDTVEVIVIPDARVRTEALRDGYVDVAALPAPEGLIEKGGFLYHPSASDMALAARSDVGMPRTVGRRAALDDGRIAERWWRI
ncbi:ABC transporter substrate-binding protein [Phaeobacter gallaeciensis]|uniref:ABC transporter substrate-binding protein n=1 Tax=Phaeobacter gallaeciensis TaxID=60890 RepID=UPI00237F131C|nr:ABC transporter substrate-binding protein [Phaeobacter gallaeciensis]MDE4192907.1 ABC transporter substrate-binding protein [Phaeobacter gallaeciensis]MDE4198525.1 ABC transporter substrate-binding protein [Phaeobacter gallaeciensis]MDE4202670.1 ABC transporter substrate-binding protein [Phaeobacter gallaeciensis]MDE4206034.1 ABC transporter substrate-binding protein [Phaeobacter gallaeciensis]MDE4214401.1 ABC transporter substrate-binding protein [Phaeobacter gallaeciensis]